MSEPQAPTLRELETLLQRGRDAQALTGFTELLLGRQGGVGRLGSEAREFVEANADDVMVERPLPAEFQPFARKLVFDDLHRQGGVGVRLNPTYLASGMGARVTPHYMPGMGSLPAAAVPNAGQAQAPVSYGPDEYDNALVSFMGFGNQVVGPTLTVNFTIQPVRPFVPQKIGFVSTILDVNLVQVDVGGTNCLSNQPANGFPLELLSEVSTLPQINWPTVNNSPGATITVINTNVGVSRTVRGGFYGTTLITA